MIIPRPRFRLRVRIPLLLTTGVSVLLAAAAAHTRAQISPTSSNVVLCVSTRGTDSGNGTESSPFATFGRVLEELERVAETDHDAHVRVRVFAGTHRIVRPIEITHAHVPKLGSLTFEGAPTGDTIVSGGVPITGWQLRDDGLWEARIPATEKWVFRELFVAGQRCPRARHPNAGYLRIDAAFPDHRTGFTFREGELPTTWTAGGELVFLHDWSTSRIPVAAVDHSTRRLTAAFPIGNSAPHFAIDHFETHPRYFVEGHCDFLDAPGEWWLEEQQGTVLYAPREGEVLNEVEIVAPRATGLVVVRGSLDHPVRNVHFQRIHFQHCAWAIPSRGYAGIQATAHEYRGAAEQTGERRFIPPALLFELAENCSFSRGTIEHVGTSGIEFGSRTRNCRLEDSVLQDISGNGVNLGEDTSRNAQGGSWWQTAPDEVASGHVVAYNEITTCGSQFYGAVGVWSGIARQMEISHNLIANHPYTGVSLGWMWSSTPTPAAENIVTNNHIHHVMQVLSDGGGIYTLGRQPGTRLTHNLIHDIPVNAGRAESNGMFIDEGSDQLLIAENTIYGVVRSPLRFHRAESVQVMGNFLAIQSNEVPALMYNSTNPETITQQDNQVLTAEELQAVRLPAPQTGPRR